ncbi:hypothetical protein [Stenotrophomonas sp. PS02298]|uniref:hypothetical protein n=1 Tax=Stenotrophomonas sp. PS02298 TaxID=2991424 RepID=UPI00249ACB2A|nr:hypothetical protein [Stenotrophomonas sp. PS02298]
MIDARQRAWWSRYPWSPVIRIAAFVTPLLALLLYARIAVAHASTQQHRGDTGLGIALLLGAVALLMLVGFFVDAVLQLVRGRHWNWITDALILGLLLMPFCWVACNWFGVHESLACRVPISLFGTVLALLSL